MLCLRTEMYDCILIVVKQNDLGMYWKHEIGLLRHFFRVDFLLDPLVFTVFMNIQNKLILWAIQRVAIMIFQIPQSNIWCAQEKILSNIAKWVMDGFKKVRSFS